MSHHHFCDDAGHYWICDGVAVRGPGEEPTLCICFDHQVPMEAGDHSDCRIELLACPEHRRISAQRTRKQRDDADAERMFIDKSGRRTVGFCLWCGCDFYTIAEHQKHTANNMAECKPFQEYLCKATGRT